MKSPIRVLHLEDSPLDAELIREQLASAGVACNIVLAADKEAFESALTRQAFDVILCDYNLPDYDGLSALWLAREKQPDTPVIVISGILGEEEAVECVKKGATDYVLKQRPQRLVSSIRRALQEAKKHRELKQAETDIRNSLEEKIVLLKEVHHRVKNNLQIVISLLNLQAVRTKNQEALDTLRQTGNRILSMALLHETLYRSKNLARVSFVSYTESICSHLFRSYGPQMARIKLEMSVKETSMEIDQAVSCGLIINELVSNALHHAFPGNRSGRIMVGLEATPEKEMTLTVSDDGVGMPPELNFEKAETLGHQLVRLLAEKLHATLEMKRDRGTTFRIAFQAKTEESPVANG
jgi:two-component sensor histidine kinase/CheY-like chemotaxis protein